MLGWSTVQQGATHKGDFGLVRTARVEELAGVNPALVLAFKELGEFTDGGESWALDEAAPDAANRRCREASVSGDFPIWAEEVGSVWAKRSGSG